MKFLSNASGSVRVAAMILTIYALYFLHILVVQPFFEYNPYTNVELVEYYREGREVHLSFVFEKKMCVIKDFSVIGLGLRVPKDIPYYDLDGKTIEDDNRLQGLQALNIKTYEFPVGVDTVQFRTRHECDGVNVDKIFYEIEVDKQEELRL